MQNSKLAKLDFLSDKMNIQFYVLGSLVLNRVCSKLDVRNIITIDNNSLGDWNMELTKKLSEPARSSNNIGDSAIPGFST